MARDRRPALPDTEPEARALYQRLTLECDKLQADLSDRNRTGPDGYRQTPAEFWQWRQRAIAALAFLREDQRLAKRHLHSFVGETTATGYRPALETVARTARTYLRALRSEEAEPDAVADTLDALVSAVRTLDKIDGREARNGSGDG